MAPLTEESVMRIHPAANTRVARGAGGLLMALGAITLAAGPAGAQDRSTTASIGLAVTGTAASATVTWQPVAGAGGYGVKPWNRAKLRGGTNAVTRRVRA